MFCVGVETCPACRGQHKAHTCGKGSGSASKPAKKGVPDGPLSPSRGSQEAVPSRTVTPPAGAEKQPAAEEEELPSTTSSSSGHLPHCSPAADPRQRTAASPDPPAVVQEGFPIALRRIHERLKDKSELLKLHLKHYHMTTEQFRKKDQCFKIAGGHL